MFILLPQTPIFDSDKSILIMYYSRWSIIDQLPLDQFGSVTFFVGEGKLSYNALMVERKLVSNFVRL